MQQDSIKYNSNMRLVTLNDNVLQLPKNRVVRIALSEIPQIALNRRV